ncbi:hypothetical protein KL930_004928 [Ogataea haglerorum]|nr:hypothetical protein KL951_001536 [Ogataea haglerorum]KAG7772869.1 hypothetical protein KL930_004928 [Ogataea haglerorum]KAG7775008.1 hypothetical protein KL922_004507 [Ogataea haglerorum]KAG7796872.1 hypothetical protein KL944_004973 [Ogataea haglerorum]
MPAMSPTMEEGGIVSWKVKEGDKFDAGDVLLEVETDKANIAVEAQDDGVMAKILKQEGEKEIKVGTPIAFLAEVGDNLAELEFPEVEEKKQEPKKEAPKTPEPAQPSPPAEPTQAKKTSTPVSSGKADPNQVFLPSVELLLEANGISRDEALLKITATGPKGRILRGDVKAYLGEIDSSNNSKIAAYLDSKSHLDLSNIELRPAAAQEKAPATKDKPKKEPVKITHQYILPDNISKDEVVKLVSKAEQKAYGKPLYAPSDLIDPLFEDIIAPPRNAERFKINTSFQTSVAEPDDDFDFEPYQETRQPNILDVELVCTDVVDAKARAEMFVDILGKYISRAEVKN